MYVTQSYLGLVVSDAQWYVYFLAQSYLGERQRQIQAEIRQRVRELGLTTGREVAAVLPVIGFEDGAALELESSADRRLQAFYRVHIAGHTPAVLITRRPLSDPQCLDGCFFVSFEHVDHPVRGIRRFLDNFRQAIGDAGVRDWLERANGFLELKPNFCGLGINLNAVLEAVVRCIPEPHDGIQD